MGYSWPGVFLLGASGRTGRFFTQLLLHDPISIYSACNLVFWKLYVTWIVYYVSLIWHVSFSLYRIHFHIRSNEGIMAGARDIVNQSES